MIEIVILSVLYLAGCVTQVALAGHFHGKCLAKRDAVNMDPRRADAFYVVPNDWLWWDRKVSTCEFFAWVCPLWVAILPIGLATAVVVGVVWGIVAAVTKLFDHQSDRSLSIENRRKELV